ncbi:MAG: M48 family metalloprotease [bacterium]|nr:M48 family metalloprotease [bacterium]
MTLSSIQKRYRLTWLLLLLAFLQAVGCAVNPVTGKKELLLMSESQEIAVGKQYYPIYTQASNGLFQDDGLQEYVNKTGKRLAQLSDRPNLDYEFNVVNSSEVNAYALPGGKISITRGLLSRMENEDQMAAVLAHEITHVAARHSAQAYTKSIAANLVLSLGQYYLEAKNVKYREYYATAGALAANLVFLKYSRDNEREADEYGMEYMIKAGYNPAGMVQTMEILQGLSKKEPSKLETMFLSHPPSSERVVAAKKRISSQQKGLPFKQEEFKNKTAYMNSLAKAYEHYDKGNELANKEKFEEAVVELKEAAGLAPKEALIQTTLAAAYFGRQRYDEASSSLSRSRSLYPDLFLTRLLGGLVYHETKEFNASIEELKTADNLVPDNLTVVFYLGRNYEEKGNRQAAADYYKKVLELTNKGEKAEYAYQRLVEWGEITPKK